MHKNVNYYVVMKNTGVVLPLLISLFLVGCSSGSSHSGASSSLGGSSPTSVASPEPSSSSSKPHVAVTSVALDQTSLELLSGDDPVTLNATVLPENASNKAVRWESSNVAAATVSDGVITPVASGTTTITAKTADGGFTATCLVYVSASQYPDYYLTGMVGG